MLAAKFGRKGPGEMQDTGGVRVHVNVAVRPWKTERKSLRALSNT